ncbi:hypothetical protein [Arcobacter sp. s6]|uniref:hypothetical protein n=1 Tax=Arcobacter sp. s6 TaxID=3230363 RepID=UPI00349FE437
MAKFAIFLLIFFSYVYSNQQIYLVEKYNENIELEAKIISNIAKASIQDKIKLYIPNISIKEKEIYSLFFTLADNCNDANFIFTKNEIKINDLCNNNINKLFITNDYKKLLKDEKYVGAFYWTKSRPNITFIKNRLENQNIHLSDAYEKFVEEF